MRNLPMRNHSARTIALLSALGGAFALGMGYVAEIWGGLVPCALCLLERWPYRLVILLGICAALARGGLARLLLLLVSLCLLADAGLAAIHVGVEFQWWRSPLPECSAPRLVSGSITERLASMPALPAKPCDDPSFLIPGLPLSMAGMNLLYALALAIFVAIWLREAYRKR
jgi:disulfide bond formation protein DsbB